MKLQLLITMSLSTMKAKLTSKYQRLKSMGMIEKAEHLILQLNSIVQCGMCDANEQHIGGCPKELPLRTKLDLYDDEIRLMCTDDDISDIISTARFLNSYDHVLPEDDGRYSFVVC